MNERWDNEMILSNLIFVYVKLLLSNRTINMNVPCSMEITRMDCFGFLRDAVICVLAEFVR